ncbi:MAG: glycine betaine/L-proline ABC transporter ATP-binding protein [Deltaproteobacteria bacterium]|nr:glycine betaine/L-proline ABC transporter ATP-binding protein [Deltaproteobacteria bacterium]
MVKVSVENLYKIFGNHPERAFKLLEKGAAKDEVMAKTGCTVGLADVSFAVEEGEILVVMGLSGSGKSTLIRCVNRLIEPTRGRVKVDDVEVTGLAQDELLELRRRKFGMVFQHFALFPHRTVVENVEFGLEIQGRDPEVRREKALESLQLVGLEGWGDSLPGQLSGGMQQRVGLARALCANPDVLLMDEAFSALDPLIRRDMQHELIALQASMQKTILFITHDLDEALKLGSRIILMKDGMIVQEGTAEDILTRPANGYVEKFVEDVDLSRVLTAGSVMVRARVVAFPTDGPRTMLHKMHEEGISSIFVVNKDYTYRGMVTADQASQAIKNGQKTMDGLVNTEITPVLESEPVSNLFAILAEHARPIPVVNEQDKLKGVVVRGSLLAGLAEGGASS